MLELRHLRYFLAVAEHLHFGKAADSLFITQPPLTRQIQQLEQILSVRLLERTKRRVALTPAGEAFRKDAERLLRDLEAAREHAQRVSRGESGELQIGFVSTVNYNILPHILKAHASRFPGVRIKLHELTSNEQITSLEDGRIDLGFMLFKDRPDLLNWLSLYKEPLVAVLPSGHHLLAGSPDKMPVAKLANEKFVFFPRLLSPQLSDRIFGYTQSHGFSPNVVQEARQMQTIIGLVAAGVGVSIVPASMQLLNRPDVRFLKITPQPPDIETGLVWNLQNDSPALSAFRSLCIDLKTNGWGFQA